MYRGLNKREPTVHTVSSIMNGMFLDKSYQMLGMSDTEHIRNEAHKYETNMKPTLFVHGF
jgi:hypothetical protein